MKWLISAVAATVVVPVLLLGGLFAAAAQTQPTPASSSSGVVPTDLPAARPFTGPDGYVEDPTSRGRITRRMLHTYREIQRVFHGWPWGVHCWDPHTWNPTSDHPKGRACDFTVGTIGRLPDRHDRAIGWRLAHWLQANAARLGISYHLGRSHLEPPLRRRWLAPPTTVPASTTPAPQRAATTTTST